MEILLVEDNPGDVRLTREAFRHSQVENQLHVVEDGLDAIRYLRREDEFHHAPRPDLVLLDLNLPRMNGREVLSAIKHDESLRQIPVVVLTTSDEDLDVRSTYSLYANCYITKPLDFERFISIVQLIDRFWFTVVKLPPTA